MATPGQPTTLCKSEYRERARNLLGGMRHAGD